ncbi:MAG: TonB-dependent receptor [Colwellia sp.]|jgi:iron complex outermembrane receptor protein|uniref:TonB-dependent receptor n=1 Tax=Colwellia sp. Bg11-12 TaxID=2759817 RepID=UPI0015F64875|nr:TonB-dependent receptor [Colwellia sp. Bg11-12]MBA6265688.1 TonB-dependent receptor [Colwellia sp. Bg11-12]
MNLFKNSALATAVKLAVLTSSVGYSAATLAEEVKEKVVGLEIIEVTARKRVENVQEVPVAISALQGEKLNVLSSAAMDIRFLNARVPSLSVESSFGRTFPRFYMRGLGNSDFDLNASQPVSLVVDEVVQENPILKGFPVFDVGRVEVLRGPQGTLFGRNTPAGLIKFESVKPSQDFDGFGSLSYGSKNTTDMRAAVGGGLTDKLSARVSLLNQTRDDYIDNQAPGFEQKEVLGGYTDKAARIQFLYEDDAFTALFNYHMRDLDGKPVAFYANAFKPGSNELVNNFERDTVYHDSASRATQQVETEGGSLKLEFELGEFTLTSISGYESAELYSRADVDGGYGATADYFPGASGPGTIGVESETADAIPDHEQLTQEIRLSSNFDGQFNYQVGAFYFNEDLTIESFAFDPLFSGGAQTGYVIQEQETTAWAVFGSFDYDYNDKTSVTFGLRYSDDDKDYSNQRTKSPLSFLGFPDAVSGEVNPSDSHVSWDISVTHKYTDDINLYARIADTFRAPSIQGRSLFAFGNGISVADSETILSLETGVKSDILDGFGRINASVFYFTMDDQQLTSVGGGGNTASLLNAEETTGYGFEIDSEFMLTDNWWLTASVSYNNTEINDSDLAVAACRLCTITDNFYTDDLGSRFAEVDGNSLPHAPEWIFNFTLRYSVEVADGEFYAYTDWSYRDDISFFLYESKEFNGKSLFEGGARTGYTWDGDNKEYEVALFVRNITDEQIAIGAVDFSNNTAIVNEERFFGAEFKVNFY